MDDAAGEARSEEAVNVLQPSWGRPSSHCEHLVKEEGAGGLSGGILAEDVHLYEDRKGNSTYVCGYCFHELQSRARADDNAHCSVLAAFAHRERVRALHIDVNHGRVGGYAMALHANARFMRAVEQRDVDVNDSLDRLCAQDYEEGSDTAWRSSILQEAQKHQRIMHSIHKRNYRCGSPHRTSRNSEGQSRGSGAGGSAGKGLSCIDGHPREGAGTRRVAEL